MTTPPRLLDFFILEAGDYLLRLETLVTQKGLQPSDAVAFAVAARGLRGSATMAKATGISSLATTVERIATGVAQGATAWEPELQRALVGAIEDLKVLVHGVRNWSTEQESRVAEAVSRLARSLWACARREKRRNSSTDLAPFLQRQRPAHRPGRGKFQDSLRAAAARAGWRDAWSPITDRRTNSDASEA